MVIILSYNVNHAILFVKIAVDQQVINVHNAMTIMILINILAPVLNKN